MGSAPRAAAPVLLAVLLAVTLPWAHAQGLDGDGELGEMAEELRRLREEVRESNRADWALFIVSLSVGTAIAVIAAWGTVRNTRQLERHVGLVESDMRTRLRPLLGWTSEGDRLVHPPSVLEGTVIVIRILNAGQVAAVGIVLDVRFGMEGDFQAGKVGHRRDQWGSLAPNRAIHLNVHVTGKQWRRAREKKEKFHVEIKAEYRGPDGREYEYSMSGDYDGRETLLRD